ncbi:MAG: peptidoglycan editing factor PgeF, partial [Firmicutes bacterium]|nr:peptidoglycan editing factor PgeF [Bacillota bacterium]
GVSAGYLSALNLGEHRGDVPENVRENYRRLGAALDIDPAKLVFSHQVHGAEVRAVTAADAHTLFAPVPYEADGLVTNQMGLPLIIFIADCVPVLLCDPGHGVIAAVHCGWRSSVADILGAAVEKMRELGAETAEIRAAIGPAIGVCCFETGANVPETLCAWLGERAEAFIYPAPKRKKKAEEKYFCDLKGANRYRLLTLGLRAENIDVAVACTMCERDKFWSHRATKGSRGSQAAVIQNCRGD